MESHPVEMLPAGFFNAKNTPFFFFYFVDKVPLLSFLRNFGSCHGSSLTMPVILYDGSEEELMDTIEREFSWPSSPSED